MAFTNNQTELIKLYLAAFLRAPEKSGLEYWLAQLEAGKSFSSLLDTVFNLDIVKTIYPLGLPTNSFVTLIYVNVFGKSPDVEGLAYWASQMNSGKDRGNLVMDMINAGLATPDGTLGKAYIVNRMAAAQFAVDQQYSQLADLLPSYLKSVMASVNSDPTTVTFANKAVNSSVTGIGIGAPINSLVAAAAADGINSAEVKAGVVVVADLTGTNAVVNNTVELLLNRGSFSTPIIKVLTDADIKAKKINLTIPASVNWGVDGQKLLSVIVKDSAGNSGLPGGDLYVELNIEPPKAASQPIKIAVASNGINLVEKSAGVSVVVNLSGTGAGVGDKLDILIGGVNFSPAASIILNVNQIQTGFASVVIAGSANWGVDGEKTLAVRITDKAGNIGGIGGTLVVMLDLTVPTAPTLPLIISAAEGGIGSEKKAENISVIVNLTGTNAQIGDNVELLINDQLFSVPTSRTITASDITSKNITLIIAGNDAAWGNIDGNRIISARIIDQAGNSSKNGGQLTVVLDTAAPNILNSSINIPASTNGISAAEKAAGVDVILNLNGTGAAVGDKVSLFLDGVAFTPTITQILTLTNINAKSVTLKIPASANWGVDGMKAITANITDTSGNVGTQGDLINALLDTTAPNATINLVSIVAATNGINFVEKNAGVVVVVDLNGTAVVPGDKMELLIGGVSFSTPIIQTLSANNITAGNVSVTITSGSGWGSDGSKDISVRMIDVAGNVGITGAALAVNLDTKAPNVPSNILVVPASSGCINAAEKTAGVDVIVNLSGTSVVAGDNVEILVGGVAFQNVVNYVLSVADITAQSVTLSIPSNAGWGVDGAKSLSARMIDIAGNVGNAGASLIVILDTIAPSASSNILVVPANSGGISGAEKAAGVDVVMNLNGTGAAVGDKVSLFLDGVAFIPEITQILALTNINAKSVTIQIPSNANWGADGMKAITTNITDTSGNVGAQGGLINVSLDTTAPNAPINIISIAASTNGINFIEKNAGVVVVIDLTGTAVVVGDKVELLIGGASFSTPLIQTLSANNITSGNVNITITSGSGWGSDGSKNISVRMIDIAGNIGNSGASLTVNLDTTAPNGPTSSLVVPANSGGISAAEKAAGVDVTISLSGTSVVAGEILEILVGGLAFQNVVNRVLSGADIIAQSVTLTIPSNAGWGADGNKTLTARFTDLAGNVGLGSGSIAITLEDSVAPNAPSVALSVAAASNGISASEKLAGVTVVANLSGTNAVAGDTAALYINGVGFSTPITQVLTGADITAGSFTCTIADGNGWGVDGTKILSMNIVDIAGNVGATGGDVSVLLDTIAPGTSSTVVTVPAASNGINITEKASGVVVTVDLSGTNAVANDKVEILLDGVSFSTPVIQSLSSANILAVSINLTVVNTSGWGADGVKSLSARAIDVAGNIGFAGGSLVTFLDTVMPTAQGLPSFVDTDSSGGISAGDVYIFTISEATNKAIGIGNITLNNSHTFGTGASASWNTAGTQLSITLGTGATIVLGDVITLIGLSDLAGNSTNIAYTV
jgi:hypothetical protein